MPDDKRAYSRPLPHTFTGVQWAAILHTLSIGVETIRNMAGDASQLDERWRIAEQEVLPELRKLVDSARFIEATGRGLDHPSRAHWVSRRCPQCRSTDGYHKMSCSDPSNTNRK